ncbi:MAG: hypothetical protein Q4C77_15040 [Eubacteriales bacterium]|nr:hypothetical protein [Eubacteriales bacterium]
MAIQKKRTPCSSNMDLRNGEPADQINTEGHEVGRTEPDRGQMAALSRLWESMEDPDGTTEEILWETLVRFQNETYYTAKGLDFTYTIKGNEMFVTRKDKSITRATVSMSFRKALELDGYVTGPKKLGTFGASYLYPVFQRLGIIKEV